MNKNNNEIILVMDFGSQYTQLIARRIREHNVFCRVIRYDTKAEEILKIDPCGIVMTGGPSSTYEGKVMPDKKIFSLGVPVLGICYGMQAMADALGGKVKKASQREYGNTKIKVRTNNLLFKGLPNSFISWMSHGDHVAKMPLHFNNYANTKHTKIASMADYKRRLFAVQFHPEVIHTQNGKKIFRNFIYNICGCSGTWTMRSFIKKSTDEIKKTVGYKNGRSSAGNVILGLSGGVDSSVCAVLLNKAIGKSLTCIFVDNGLCRKDEGRRVYEIFKKHFRINLRYVDAGAGFLKRLKGVVSPELKRKIIGKEFIRVFDGEAKKIGGIKFLAQGTLYPDVIESRSAFGGPSATIKTHHNVGGLPKKMKLKLIEPLKDLFKDEVRQLGLELGMSEELIFRQPFPGPGLAVRILGEVTKERLDILKEVDWHVIDAIKKAGLYRNLWQAFAVLLPIKSVGVMGDKRTYENVVAIRAVTSEDAMTADWARLPYDLLAALSNKIINEVEGVNRVVYDISSKPPSTIEWE